MRVRPWTAGDGCATRRGRGGNVLEIFVDADACPVKEEIYRIARRHGLRVRVVSNSWMRVPLDPQLELVVVDKQFNQADDWIAERAGEDDIVISADIPLAARCLRNGARVLGPTGRAFTEDSIGEALATRELLATLREAGEETRGPPPFTRRDRSRFLQRLDDMIRAIQRRRARG
ncbi:MAG: YaiI/YqxD family protein [Planctomycetes bacterium]|nr:YaiI/YqxD family protein [Planctomycetota bacterium]